MPDFKSFEDRLIRAIGKGGGSIPASSDFSKIEGQLSRQAVAQEKQTRLSFETEPKSYTDGIVPLEDKAVFNELVSYMSYGINRQNVKGFMNTILSVNPIVSTVIENIFIVPQTSTLSSTYDNESFSEFSAATNQYVILVYVNNLVKKQNFVLQLIINQYSVNDVAGGDVIFEVSPLKTIQENELADNWEDILETLYRQPLNHTALKLIDTYPFQLNDTGNSRFFEYLNKSVKVLEPSIVESLLNEGTEDSFLEKIHQLF